MNLHNDEAHANPDFMVCAECSWESAMIVAKALAAEVREKTLLEEFERYAPMVVKELKKMGVRFPQ